MVSVTSSVGGAPLDKINFATNFYLSKGLSVQGATYLVGNLIQESRLDPNAVGDGGSAKGLAQWHPDRRYDMPSDFKGQLEFTLKEMERDSPGRVLSVLKNPKASVSEVKNALKSWERYGVEGARYQYGAELYSKVSGQPLSVDQAALASSPSSSSLPGDPANIVNAIGSALGAIKSAIFGGENCPPPAYTQAARITYTGCQTKLTSAVLAGGQGMGATAPALGSVGSAEPGIGATAYTGPLKAGGFIKPCKGELTSPFGMRWGRMHSGVDYANAQGTPIIASADGTVKYTISSCTQRNRGAGVGDECGGGGYGNQIGIDHKGGLFTLYTHLTTVMVKPGQQVKQGQQVGTMGSTGGSTGDHTHFEIRQGENGTRMDPVKFVGGA